MIDISRAPASSTPRAQDTLASFTLVVALSAFVVLASGCSGAKTIIETRLAITPTESSASFSRPSQDVIADLALTPDMLADPKALEENSTLAALSPSVRSLLLSESWFLRGENDIDVPIATSLDRFLRAAHFAYDGIFVGDDCDPGEPHRCIELFDSYNRAVREVGRLTNNGAQLPPSSETSYLIERGEDADLLDLNEWELYLTDTSTTSGHSTFGAAGAACQTLASDNPERSAVVRRCTPTTLTVSFDKRADGGESRADLAAYNTFGRERLILHSKALRVPVDLHFTWTHIFSPSPTQSLTATCLADVEAQLPTVFLSVAPSSPDSHWTTLAANLTSEPHIQDRFNFCVLSSQATSNEAQPFQRIRDSLSLASLGSSEKQVIVLITQGAASGGVIRQVKDSLRQARRERTGHNLVLAGSLALPSPVTAHSSAAHQEPLSSELSKRELSALSDMRRLLNRLSDSDDADLSPVTRGSLQNHPGMTLSPVM